MNIFHPGARDELRYHRHQVSLEAVLHLQSPALTTSERAQAKAKFYAIVRHFEMAKPRLGQQQPYDRFKLVQLTYEYARSDESKDIFLRAFFMAADIAIDDTPIDLARQDVEESVGSATAEFADYLVDNLFLPMKASTRRTLQPSPIIHSAVQQEQAGAGGGTQDFIDTPGRLAELRGQCLSRDRFRCVVSRKFDIDEYLRRDKQNGSNALDDDGNLLEDEGNMDDLEVTHIIPHSLTQTEEDGNLNPFKKAALDILNMLDHGVLPLIEGTNIDKPRNALSLTHRLHRRFGEFQVYFQPGTPNTPHNYRIKSFLPPCVLTELPVTRTLYLSDDRMIDPPSPRLLALHCAIAHILHFSVAGKYINRVLEDLEKGAVASEGTTPLGELVALRLGGFLDACMRA